MRFAMKLQLFLLLFGITIIDVFGGDVVFTYFEDESEMFKVTQPLQGSYADFGPFPHWCAGDSSSCTNGFSLEFSMKPFVRQVEGERTIILTNGGHLPYSDGFYIERSFADQYNFYFTRTDKELTVSFHIVHSEWVYIILTWEETAGLSIYIDGYLVGTDVGWEPRQYSAQTFDPCTSILAGLRPDYTPQTTAQVMDLKEINMHKYIVNVPNLVAAKLTTLMLGCVEGIDISNLPSKELVASADVNKDCRDLCFESNSSIALLKDLTTCVCATYKFLEPLSVDKSCTTSSEWYIYVVNHLKRDVEYTLVLQKEAKTDKEYVAPYVTVLFTYTTGLPLNLEYEITFGDGTKVYTSDTSYEYYWSKPGSYTITVLVKIGILLLQAKDTIEIESREEGRPPQKIFTDVFQTSSSNEVNVTLVSVDAELTNCSLTLGYDGTVEKFEGPHFCDAKSFIHQFRNVGYYQVSVQCSNSYGSITNSSAFTTRDWSIPSLIHKAGAPLELSIVGSAEFLATVTATVNEKTAQTTVASQPTAIDNGSPVRRRRAADDVQINAHAGAIIISGDSFTEPFTNLVKISHDDNVMRTYIVDVQNSIPDIDIIAESFVLSEPGTVVITIVVQSGSHLDVVIDYGDESVEHIRVGEVKNSLDIERSIDYSEFRNYTISATIANEVGDNSISKIVSIEESMVYVDLSTSTPRITAGDKATIKVTFPKGSNIVFNVDFGDESNFEFYQNDLNPSLRSEDELTEASILEDGSISLAHTYISSGHYSVSVDARNHFSSHQCTLCPKIVSALQTLCTVKNIVIKDLSLPDTPVEIPETDSTKPLIKPRSVTIIYAGEAQSDCVNNATLLYSWRMTRIYEADKNTPAYSRPVTSICDFQLSRNTLTLQPLQLEFGLYKITLTVSMQDDDLAFSETSFYLRIGTSLPKAVLGGGEAKTYIIYQTVVLDLSESKDPDLNKNVREGLLYEIFCMLEMDKSKAEDMEIDDLRSSSTEVLGGWFYPSTTNNIVKLYEYTQCFGSVENVTADLTMTDGKLLMSANVFRPDRSSFYVVACVTKGDRYKCANQLLRIKLSNTTGDDALLNGFLENGDILGLATAVIEMADGMGSDNDTDSENIEENANRRGKLLAFLKTGSDIVENLEGVSRCMTAVKIVTNKASEISDDSRSTAGSAISNLANKTTGLDSSLDSVTEAAEELTGALDNILPRSEEETKLAVAEARRKKRSLRKKRDAENIEESLPDKPEKDDYSQLLVEYNVPDSPEAKALYNYIFHDMLLFKKTLKTLDRSEMNAIILQANTDYQEQIWASIATGEEPGDLYEFYIVPLTLAKAERNAARKEADKDVVGKSSSAINNIGNTLIGKKEDSVPLQINSPRLAVAFQKLNPNETDGKDQAIESNSGGFKMPSSLLSAIGSSNNSLGTQFYVAKNNPYTWSEEQSETPVVSLKYTAEDGSPVEVKDAKEPMALSMNTREKADALPPPGENAIIAEHGEKAQEFNYHHINVTSKNTTIFIYIWPNGTDVTFEVFVAFGVQPNMSYYNFSGITSNDRTFPDVSDEDVRDHLEHAIVVNSSVTRQNGTYHVGVKVKSANVITDEDYSVHGYKIRMFNSKCKYWDEKEEKWSSEGCELTNMTTPYSTECLCTHLTSFGGGFAVPVNTIDFSNVWAKFGNLSENASVFSTVISMIGIYIILLIWARRQDKKDVLKWGATPLEDNLPTDNYHYQLSVYTGVKKNAGTSSRVNFILSGDNGDTGARILFDGKRKHFKTGSIMNFIMSVEACLGPMTFLRIWHDNSGQGKNKGWFLDQVQLTDLQTGDKFFFLNDRWLAVEEDDGQVDRIIPVAGIEDLIAFKTLFSSGMRKKISNDHLWVSIFSRPTRSSFTRMQRVSCCVSLLFLTMITNCMWFKSDENGTKTGLKLGPFQFTLQQVFVSVVSTLIVFPVSFLQVTMFRRCRPKNTGVMQVNQQIPKRGKKYRWKTITQSNSAIWGNMEQSKMRKFQMGVKGILSFHGQNKYDDDEPETAEKPAAKKKGWSLPHWCLYIAWGLCFLTVLTSGFFTILYSMEWGSSKSLDWLTTFLLSFFQSVVIVQPIKVLLLVAFLACIFKKPDIDGEDDTHDLKNVLAPDEELVCDKQDVDINAIKLQRAIAQNSVQTADPAYLEEQKQLRLNEIKMEQVLKEIIIYVFFVLILFFLSYQQRDSSSFGVAQNLRTMFVGKFDKISTVLDYWVWLEGTFLPAFFVQKYQDSSPVTLWWDKRCTVDLTHRRVGIARLRQMRIKENSCSIIKDLAPLINHCRDEYSWTDDDTKPYLPKWEDPPEENKTALEKERDNPFVYQNSLRLKNAPYVGMITTYKGGGYVANFKRGFKRTKTMLTELKQNDWLDLKTRAVFLEFTVINPNLNLFGSVTMLVEFMATGAATTRSEFKVFRIFNYVGAMGIVVILFEVLYGCFAIYFFVRCVKKVKKERLKYFGQFWNLLEFVMLCFCITCIVMYIFKHILITAAMNTLKESGAGDFVNFQSLALYDEMYGYMCAIVVFLATIQVLRFLQFNKKMNMLGDTIKLASKDLKVFSISFLLYFMTFTMTAYLLFGPVMVTYNSVVGSAETLFAFSLGSFDYTAMVTAQPILGNAFFFLFIGIIYIGMMSIFLTIICEAFSSVKANIHLRSNEYELVDFMIKKVKQILGVK